MAAFPVRVVYILKERACEDDPAVQLLVSVSKRHFKHAVDRNRIKRQLREAYRQHKQLLADVLPADQQAALAFIWLSDNHLPSADIESRVVNLLHRIRTKIENLTPVGLHRPSLVGKDREEGSI